MKSCFYVDNALMIISWKRDVGSIQMQNIILYVVAVYFIVVLYFRIPKKDKTSASFQNSMDSCVKDF